MKLLDIIHTLDNYREVSPEDTDDKLFKRIRIWRNEQLVKSDWTQLADSVCNKTAWAEYRQTLRDLPVSNPDPQQIEIPIQPGGN